MIVKISSSLKVAQISIRKYTMIIKILNWKYTSLNYIGMYSEKKSELLDDYLKSYD